MPDRLNCAHALNDTAQCAPRSITCQVIDWRRRARNHPSAAVRLLSIAPLRGTVRETAMDTFRSMTFLRKVLLLDAVSSALMGAALLALSGLFAALLDLPATLLLESGFVLVPFAAFVG